MGCCYMLTAIFIFFKKNVYLSIALHCVQIISFVTVCYMCVCAYSSLLRLKVFNFYVLVPNHQTDELSLLWFAAYLCRLM